MEKRRFGSFSRHLSVIVSRSLEMFALSLRGLGGSSWMTCLISIRALPRKGSSPVTSWKRLRSE